jgi:hypothetical protein
MRLGAGAFPAFDAQKSSECRLNLRWPGHNGRLAAVALTHPCRPDNARWRTHGKLTGRDAKLAMVRDALRASGAP